MQPKEHYSVDGNESLVGSAAVCKASSLLTYEVKAWGRGGGHRKADMQWCNSPDYEPMVIYLCISSIWVKHPVSRGGECKAGAQREERKCYLLYLTWVSVQKLTRYWRIGVWWQFSQHSLKKAWKRFSSVSEPKRIYIKQQITEAQYYELVVRR